MEKNLDNLTEKSPSLDRSVIEEFNNLDRVALRNLKDWDKRVGDATTGQDDVDKEWSPSSSDVASVETSKEDGGATALSYDDITQERSPMPELVTDDEVTDSDIETAGSDEDRDDLTDYENSDMVEYQAAVEAGREDEERQCWVCFASQDDDPVAAWVHPCLCKGTTKWVHQVSSRIFIGSMN